MYRLFIVKHRNRNLLLCPAHDCFSLLHLCNFHYFQYFLIARAHCKRVCWMLLGVMWINKLSIYLSIKGFLQWTVIQRSVFNSFFYFFQMPENLHGTTLTRFFVGSAYKVRTANFVQCEFNVNSNEWVNEFYQCIGNNPRIFSMISIQFLAFCGVFMEGAKWITRCRLNKIKDGWKLSGCLLTQKKKDMGSIRSWTYFYKLFVKDKRQTDRRR